MNNRYARHHLRALALAGECVALGARARTVGFVTGLPPGEVARLFLADGGTAPRGRAPDSPDWYHNANLILRVGASVLLSVYRRIRECGIGPAEALVAAYRHYLTACIGPPRISFDRAFDLVSHLDGIWIRQTPALLLVSCPVCGCRHAAPPGPAPAGGCPFCRLAARYRNDPRIRCAFPLRGVPDLPLAQAGVPALLRQG